MMRPPLRDNEHAVDEDGPVVSAHRSTAAGTTFYVVTTADRSETTVFLPAEVSLCSDAHKVE